MREPMVMLILTIGFVNLGVLVSADAYSHRYKKGDEVPLYANKVGPYSNPSETYAYFDLPFCLPDKLSKKEKSLGEGLNGDNLVSAAYKLRFLEEKESDVLCRRRLGKEEVRQFKNAIAQDYYFKMYYDDLPMWGFIGQVRWRGSAETDYKYHLFTHIQFEVLYNGDRVIAIHPRMEHWCTVDVTDEKEIDVEFLYTVTWEETNTSFEKRMDMYYMPHQLAIHWISIENSCVTILFIIGGLVTIYLRVLKRDILKYSQDEESTEFQETGWKVLHGDVFRYPKHKSLFAAAIGSGTQLFLVTLCALTLGIFGVFHPSERGVIPRTIVIIYAITSGISGFTAVSFYHQLEGSNWIRNLLLTGGIFCGPFFITFCFLNTIAIVYGSIAALSSGTIAVMLLLWIFLAFPSLLLGGILGKNIKLEFQAPCRTTKCPRDIPQLRWYRGVLFQMALAGILPFYVIYIQLIDIFTSSWHHFMYNYKTYHTLFVVFILLIIVTALVSIALTYSQLAAEDHEWWWRSFLCGGSTGVYMFGYTIYYYFQESYMKGLMQTSFLFGYMGCVSFGVFVMLGTVGFRASSLFVRLVYGCIKCE